MEVKLYVGNLSYATTEEEIRELFEQAGSVVSVELIRDRDTNRSKGFAFVAMGSQKEAEQAINQYNGYLLSGRNLTVNVARPREERPRTYGGNRSGGYDKRGGGSGGGYNRRGSGGSGSSSGGGRDRRGGKDWY
jgi:RNA recognition motif-containing protein